MTTESTVPLLPCRSLAESLAFYESLGFTCTFRQQRPNPCASVTRGGIDIFLFEIDGFVPEDSYGSILILTTDTEKLFDEFATGLRTAHGRLPISGIPRITRPRKKQGTAGGFSVVDPGGNWLRVFRRGDPETSDTVRGLARVVENAARQGDAHGDDAAAIAVLDAGLLRYPDAAPLDRLPALVYRAELDLRVGNTRRARETLGEVLAIPLDEAESAALEADIDAARELLAATPDPADPAAT
jgi:catechol 2,3-dioxygenase-like lactoylglutathione lyase family enzyme